MLNIVLFGRPGAGKGTQSHRLLEKYGLVHLSTGEILRHEIEKESELGKEAKNLMDQGLLVPDELVIGMINNKLEENKFAKGFIFDGFPRTITQAAALDRLLEKHDTLITTMIALKVDDNELVRRLLKRGIEEGRIDDANEDLIRNRIHTYIKNTRPVASYYKKQNKFIAIDGEGEIEDIFNHITENIDQIYQPI